MHDSMENQASVWMALIARSAASDWRGDRTCDAQLAWVAPLRKAVNSPTTTMISPVTAVMMPTQSGPPLTVVKPEMTANAIAPTPAAIDSIPMFLSPLVAFGVLLRQFQQSDARESCSCGTSRPSCMRDVTPYLGSHYRSTSMRAAPKERRSRRPYTSGP